MNPLVSIIVPVYKAEAFIADAIESIVQQTCNYEAIFIDDGSPDRSGDIIKKYQQINSRLKYYRQENRGVNKAREAGVKVATGEWIAFLDADDLLAPSFSEVVEKWDQKYSGDIVVTYNHDLLPVEKDYSVDIETYRNKIIIGEIYTGPWGRLFRRRIFDGRTFALPREIASAEDLLMNIRLSFNTIKAVQITKDFYYIGRFTLNPNSAMKTFRPSWGYSQLFDKYFNASFPNDLRNRYLKSIIIRRLSIWHETFRKKWKLPKEATDSEFYSILIADLDRTGYVPPFCEYMNLRLRNPLLRGTMDIFIRIHGLIQRYIIKPLSK